LASARRPAAANASAEEARSDPTDAATVRTAWPPATEVEVEEAAVEAGSAGHSTGAPRLSGRWRPTWLSKCRQSSSPAKALSAARHDGLQKMARCAGIHADHQTKAPATVLA
jgi:hypothetical protein